LTQHATERRERLSRRLFCGGANQLQQVANPAVTFNWVTQLPVDLNAISISSPHSLAFDIPGTFEIQDDTLHGAFGNADLDGDLSKHLLRIGMQQDQDVRMVGQKGPATTAFGGFPDF